MNTFLTEIARRLRDEHPHDLDRVTVVFNNRRSGLFLRRQFARLGDAPFFLPRILGIDELVAQLGGLEIVPNELLLFDLFDIHRNIDNPGRKFETFEEFISFGEMMIADFSEIDLYLVDAQRLFSNLHDLKALGEWDIESGTLTPFQQQYLHFYQSLYQYYTGLHNRLQERRQAYTGMAYREVAEHIDTLLPNLDCDSLWFVGFNALSASEHRIIQHCVRQGIGTLCTDGDAYYYDNPVQEAGHFLRRHADQFPGIGNYPDHFAKEPKRITLVSCPEPVLQCKYAGRLLEQFTALDEPLEQTALVLGDENLLLPTLNSLPERVHTANITMGYPFTNTMAHTLMLKLFSLHQQRHGTYFYHKDLNDLLSDRHIAPLTGSHDLHAKLTRLLAHRHIVYADLDTLHALLQELGCTSDRIDYLFPDTTPTPEELLHMARQLVTEVYNSGIVAQHRQETEALGCLFQTIEYLEGLQEQYHCIDSLNVLLKIYTRLAQRRSVAFYGEPLSGLQILGMLETRNLDFRRVILLSANEGTMPAGNTGNSLIPYNLKVAFGLPTYHEKDAVYAYNFYRLLQRAEEVYILYSTDTDGMGKGEPSRFLLQVRDELAPRYPEQITLREEVLEATNETPQSRHLHCADKRPEILHRLREMADYGFSPSSLNKYRNCPLRFYYENVLQLQEIEEVSEDLEQSNLGTCIHAALQQIYSRDADRLVRKESLQHALDNLDGLLDEVLKVQFDHGRSHLGRNHFLESVARKQIASFLRSEIRYLGQGNTIEVVGLEQPLKHSLPVGDSSVKLIGTADRIDRSAGRLRIIDYKSGKVEEKDLHVASPDTDLLEVKDKWFQVMFYAWLYLRDNSSNEPCVAGIQPLGRLDSPLLTVSWDGQEILSADLLDRFETLLTQLLADLFNPDLPFEAKSDSPTCKYCPFLDTCQGKN